jgi:hypothetical protein
MLQYLDIEASSEIIDLREQEKWSYPRGFFVGAFILR